MPLFEIRESKTFVRSGVIDAANDTEALRLFNAGEVKMVPAVSPDSDLQISQLTELEESSEKMALAPCA